MKNPCTTSCSQCSNGSTAISERRFAASGQQSLFKMTPAPEPGALNDASRVRESLRRTIKHCGKSREQIAESMSRLCGYSVTVTMLNAFTAESRDDRRFPLELLRAFSIATGDSSLLVEIVHALNLDLVTETESNVLALGREYLRQKRASEAMRTLEELLARREL